MNRSVTPFRTRRAGELAAQPEAPARPPEAAAGLPEQEAFAASAPALPAPRAPATRPMPSAVQATPAPSGAAAGPRPEDRMGDRLVAAGLLGPDEVRRIVEFQHAHGLRFGEAAIRLGLLAERDIQHALAAQFSYAMAGAAHVAVHPSLAIAHEPFSAQAEAVRQVRAEISIRLEGCDKPSIAVVSPGDGEGKSYLAASLAIAFSQSGFRTLLIDADLRTRGKTRLFDIPGDTGPGLSAILAGRAAPGPEPGRPVPDFPLLHVLASGPLPPNPAEILAEPALRHLIRRWQDGFDICIVDTPAVNRYSDAQLIGRQVDACVLAGRQDGTRVSELRRAQDRMQSAGARLLGAVYNAAEPRPAGWGAGLLARLRALAERAGAGRAR